MVEPLGPWQGHGDSGGESFSPIGGAGGQAPMPQTRRRPVSNDHLATEAIAAYVDGELRMSAHMRASAHLSVCPECFAEVEAQRQARAALRRGADELPVPDSLLGQLRGIPEWLPQSTMPGFAAGFVGGPSGTTNEPDTGAIRRLRDRFRRH